MSESNLIISHSKVEGSGVFANKDFGKGDKIFLFSDKIIEIQHKKGCDCKICRRCIQIGQSNWLYPKKNSPGWNLNHNCDPSCYINKDNHICALKNIKKGEEITIDYSTTNCDESWSMKCLCNSKNCRKLILPIQYLPLDIFKKFIGKMPIYVEEKYTLKQVTFQSRLFF